MLYKEFEKNREDILENEFCMQMCIRDRLYVWQQLNYNQERDELHLTGILKDKEELLKELRNYLRQVFVLSHKAEFNRSEISKIEEIPFDMQTL